MISGRPIRFSQPDGSGNSREIPPGPKGKRRLRVRGRFSFFSPRNRRFRGPLGERRKKGPHGPSGRTSAAGQGRCFPPPSGLRICRRGWVPALLSKDIIARPRENVKGEDAFFQSFVYELICRPVGERKKVGWHYSSIQPVSFNHGLARGLISPFKPKRRQAKTPKRPARPI